MRRYLLFAGEDYYPSGGFTDFVGDFSKLTNAVAFNLPEDSEWAHILDTKTGEVALWWSDTVPHWLPEAEHDAAEAAALEAWHTDHKRTFMASSARYFFASTTSPILPPK